LTRAEVRGACNVPVALGCLLTDVTTLGERMEIHMNITFPKIPCELLTLDVMDVSGEQQHGVLAGVRKARLEPAEKGGKVIDMKRLSM
jgi:endoplasmic reticulum-Golgi intermediate compartment protein 3